MKNAILYTIVAAVIAALFFMMCDDGGADRSPANAGNADAFISQFNRETDNPIVPDVTYYKVTYDGNGSNGGSVPVDGNSYQSGSDVTVRGGGNLTRNGYIFSGWSTQNDGEGGQQFGAGETFTITANTTLYARWTSTAVTTYKVTVENGTGGGDFEAGRTVTITAGTAPAGQRFANWTVSDSGVTLNDPNSQTTAFTMPANAVTVRANFEAIPQAQTYTLTVNASPSNGGTVSRNPNQANYASGASVTVTASAASGYKFTGWSGASTATSASVTITMNGNKTLTANFEAVSVGNVPSTPTNLRATETTANSISLSWEPVPDATQYKVYRSTTSTGTYTLVGSPTSAPYTNTGLSSGTTYYYKVSASNGSAESAQSSAVNANTTCGFYCYWGSNGCAVVGPYDDYPTCAKAIENCDVNGGGRYTNASCSGTPVVANHDVYCNGFCMWDNVCYEMRTDKRGAYGSPTNECESVVDDCERYSEPRRTFATLAACEAAHAPAWSSAPSVGALAKSKSPALRVFYSKGAVEVSFSTESKVSGGTAELINSMDAAVSSAVVKVKGKKVTATLDAEAVPSGIYFVRISLMDVDGKKLVEEASIGIVK